MAKIYPEAALIGYGYPIFPGGIRDLTAVLREIKIDDKPVGNTPIELEKIARNVEGFVEISNRPETDDGYQWLIGLKFTQNGKGGMVVLIPDKYAKQKRSIAVHTIGTVHRTYIDKVLADLVTCAVSI